MRVRSVSEYGGGCWCECCSGTRYTIVYRSHRIRRKGELAVAKNDECNERTKLQEQQRAGTTTLMTTYKETMEGPGGVVSWK